jgi:hypothetical protein
MGYAFDLQERLADVKQQAESQTGRFQIIGALHSTRVVKCFDGLQRDHHENAR